MMRVLGAFDFDDDDARLRDVTAQRAAAPEANTRLQLGSCHVRSSAFRHAGVNFICIMYVCMPLELQLPFDTVRCEMNIYIY